MLKKFPQELESKSIAELENILKDIKFSVANVTSTSFVTSVFGHTVKTVEKLSAFTSLDLTGLHDSLSKNDETFYLLEELRLEYQSFTYTRPETRLAFLMARTALAVNAQNKALKAQAKSKLDEKADQKLMDELAKLETKK